LFFCPTTLSVLFHPLFPQTSSLPLMFPQPVTTLPLPPTHSPPTD
jgi:hypothetical protein